MSYIYIYHRGVIINESRRIVCPQLKNVILRVQSSSDIDFTSFFLVYIHIYIYYVHSSKNRHTVFYQRVIIININTQYNTREYYTTMI